MNNSLNKTDNWLLPIMESIKKSLFLRTLLIGFLILIMQIPIVMINGVIRERKQTKDEAFMDVTSSWGSDQAIVGPWITVPYSHHSVEKKTSGDRVENFTTTEIRYATFLPEKLKIDGRSSNNSRKRGIFQVPLYNFSATISGEFAKPDFSAWGISSEDILWGRSYLSLGISDSKGITKQSVLDWGGEKINFKPGSTTQAFGLNYGGPGIHALLESHLEGDAFEFSFPVQLNGSDSLFFTPYGHETEIELESDWPDPSFVGNWIPRKHKISADGFSATWNVPYLGRNYPQKWKTGSNLNEVIKASFFGVKFLVPIDNYRMGFRSVKYAPLFLMLTFITLWLFEILAGSRIHPLQYLLLGAGMCVFYLLELSLAEHIGFVAAYIIASVAVVALIGSYSFVCLKSSLKASIVGLIASVLYGYLYVLLRSQDYALLIGSIGLFVVIAAIMYLTRNINWYDGKRKSVQILAE